ncbi:MAG: hypothetical protein ACXVAX_01090 [Pseudobdellovibrio sp.]
MSNLRILTLAVLVFVLFGCTEEPKYKPTLEKYTHDTNLMLNVCTKFADEQDAARLHKVVVAMQTSRAVTCPGDFNGECRAYDDFMSTALEVTEDNKFTSDAQLKLKQKLTELTRAVSEGRLKLMQK